MKKINRRNFLKVVALGGAAGIGGAIKVFLGLHNTPTASGAFPAPETYLPIVMGLDQSTNGGNGQIIADHTVVNQYGKIPAQYKSQVKKMWADLLGESHSRGFEIGCQKLFEQDDTAAVSWSYDVPEAYTSEHLRINRTSWGNVDQASGWISYYGEEDWFTSSTAIQRTKAHLDYCHSHNLAIAAMGFIWCWDMLSDWIDGGVDPVYKVRWAGSSGGGPDGDHYWGLDAEDYSLTGNHVCMDIYLNATVDFINHCQSRGYATKIFFTTGPVDTTQPYTNVDESGYQREIKHQYIRDFVKKDSNRILFDYADILSWNNNNQLKQITWDNNWTGTTVTYPLIHPDNMQDIGGGYSEDGDHIGSVGAVRLAKALWWMLARIAGWDGN